MNISFSIDEERGKALLENYNNNIDKVNEHFKEVVEEESDSIIANQENEVNAWFQGLSLKEKRAIKEEVNQTPTKLGGNQHVRQECLTYHFKKEK